MQQLKTRCLANVANLRPHRLPCTYAPIRHTLSRDYTSVLSRSGAHRSLLSPRITARGYRTHFRNNEGRRSNRFVDAINRIPPTALVVGILAANGMVFMMWQGAKGQAAEGDWSQLKWMVQTFTSSAENLKTGRIWVLLTSCFSHESVSHLLFNSFTFFFVGPPTIGILGNVRFLALYLGGGVFGNLVSFGWHRAKDDNRYSSHGASGAIYAVLSFFACVAPKTVFYVYGIVPVPAWAIIPGVLLWDTWGSLSNKKSGTDHSGHVGGILAGILYYFAL